MFRCMWTSIIWMQKLPLSHNYATRVSSSDISTWISLRLSYCIMWLADTHCSISDNQSYDICWRASGAHDSGWMLIFHSKYIHGFRLLVHLQFTTDDWLKPIAASFSQLDTCHWRCNRSVGGTSYVKYQFTSSHMVIINIQERQWNHSLAIPNSRYNNYNIRTLIHFNIEDRKIHLSSVVPLTNDFFDCLYQFRRSWCFNVKRAKPWWRVYHSKINGSSDCKVPPLSISRSVWSSRASSSQYIIDIVKFSCIIKLCRSQIATTPVCGWRSLTWLC